jgi:histidinol phosphatase-like PHP family hydrolase
MERGTIHVVSHPYRPNFSVDVVELARVAAGTGVCLEVNVSLLKWAIRPDPSPTRLDVLHHTRRMLDEMARVGACCMVGSDAHHSSEVSDFPTNSRDVIGALEIPISMITNRAPATLIEHLKAFR